ncbi:MAG TPA: acyltransferase [Bryobacteraceae bacterium]|nr:acyltransferase [Bryobacteraceae bacterium]
MTAGTIPALYQRRFPTPKPVPFARPGRSKNLPALTGLRFFLALWVIFGHLVGKGHVLEPIAAMMPGPLQPIARAGYLAVPTFFVLSGFVLAANYAPTEWNRRNLWKYLVGRFARIYPVYLLSLLIVLPFMVKAKDQPKGWLVAMHFTLTQGWFVGHYTAGWNTPAWTLSCEIFFYVMFPLLIVPMRHRGWAATAGVALATCVLPPAMWACGIPDQLKPVIHLADFLMGIAVARAFEMLTARTAPPAGKWFYRIGLFGSAALIAYARFLPKSIPLNSLLRPMNALLLLGLALGGGWIARSLSMRPVEYLGKASYGMYILHIPILWWTVAWPEIFNQFFYVPVVVAISCIVYAVLEEPANRSIRSLVGKRKFHAHLTTAGSVK